MEVTVPSCSSQDLERDMRQRQRDAERQRQHLEAMYPQLGASRRYEAKLARLQVASAPPVWQATAALLRVDAVRPVPGGSACDAAGPGGSGAVAVGGVRSGEGATRSSAQHRPTTAPLPLPWTQWRVTAGGRAPWVVAADGRARERVASGRWRTAACSSSGIQDGGAPLASAAGAAGSSSAAAP